MKRSNERRVFAKARLRPRVGFRRPRSRPKLSEVKAKAKDTDFDLKDQGTNRELTPPIDYNTGTPGLFSRTRLRPRSCKLSLQMSQILKTVSFNVRTSTKSRKLNTVANRNFTTGYCLSKCVPRVAVALLVSVIGSFLL